MGSRSVLISAKSGRPGGVQVIEGSGTDHFHAVDFSIFNKECLCDKDAGRSVESGEFIRTAVGESPFAHCALVKNSMGPYNAALPVYNRIATTVNILDHKIDAQFELGHAIHGKEIDTVRRFVLASRQIRGGEPVFYPVAVRGKGVGACSVDSLAVVSLQS